MYYLRRLTVTNTSPVEMRVVLDIILLDTRLKYKVLDGLARSFSNGQTDYDEHFEGIDFPMRDAPHNLMLLAEDKAVMEVFWKGDNL